MVGGIPSACLWSVVFWLFIIFNEVCFWFPKIKRVDSTWILSLWVWVVGVAPKPKVQKRTRKGGKQKIGSTRTTTSLKVRNYTLFFFFFWISNPLINIVLFKESHLKITNFHNVFFFFLISKSLHKHCYLFILWSVILP